MGRPRRFDRQTAIDVAVELFWRKGYTSTSVAELCKAMGIFSPSFYAAFGSKEACYMEVVARYSELREPLIWDSLEAAPTAREGIEAVLNNAILAHTDPLFPPGCLVILSTAEVEGDARLKDHMASLRARLLELLRVRLRRAAIEGELDSQCDIDDLARVFFTLEQGIALQARDGVPRDALLAMVRATMRAWPALISPISEAAPR